MKKKVVGIVVLMLVATTVVSATNINIREDSQMTIPLSNMEMKKIYLGYTPEPVNTNNVTWLHYDDGDPNLMCGSTWPPLFMAIRLTNDELAPYNGGRFIETTWYHIVSNVSISDHTYDAKIWIGNETRPITLLLNDTGLTASGEGWTNHTLSTPVVIDASKDYWIVIKCYAYPAQAYYDYPMPCDTNTSNHISQKSHWWHNSNNHTETDFYETPQIEGAWCLRIAVEPPQLSITIKGGFGISATIKNTGTTNLTNVDYTINLDGKLIFVGKSKSDTIATLAAGKEVKVKDFVIGFGKTGIAVTAGSASANASGTALLIFVIGVK